MSSDAAINVEGLSKRYQLGARVDSRATFREKVNDLALSPYRRLQSVFRGESAQVSGAELWALNDVSFSVPYGEVVGVIGRNGAGKSTLLKILARVTEPTRGRAVIHGRVGSLLEVGTGFHSELTGRENVFLNGVILGMTQTEIASKLDQIVAFAEVERFLDTQVKHYSSGMSLRLAFAVAAHLQPEILLVDEVLAVGDTAFQRKCLGKMNDVAYDGRAILFVSHNLEAVQRLCHRCVWIDAGRLRMDGDTASVVRAYLEDGEALASTYRNDHRSTADNPIILREADLRNERDEPSDTICFGEPFSLRLLWDLSVPLNDIDFVVQVRDASDRLVFASRTQEALFDVTAGTTESICRVRQNVLRPGDYSVYVTCVRARKRLHRAPRCLGIRVLDVPGRGRTLPQLHREALVAPHTDWEVCDALAAAHRCSGKQAAGV